MAENDLSSERPVANFTTLNLFGVTSREQAGRLSRHNAVQSAARRLGASPSGLMGLWNVPGYGELTEGQLLDLASRR